MGLRKKLVNPTTIDIGDRKYTEVGKAKNLSIQYNSIYTFWFVEIFACP